MSVGGVEGLVVILPGDADDTPHWWKVVDGHIVSRSRGAAAAGADLQINGSGMSRVMLVVPQSAVAMRRVVLPADMPSAQARVVAPRMACEASIGPSEYLHAAAFSDPQTVAVISRQDMEHFLGWSLQQGFDPDIVIPAGAILPEPDEGYVSASLCNMKLLRGRSLCVDAGEDWTEAVAGQALIHSFDADAVDLAVAAALQNPPVNLRTGLFAPRRSNGADADFVRRIAIWAALIVMVTLLISLALIGRYYWSASQLDAKAVAIAQPLLPEVTDARQVDRKLDALIAQRGGGGYHFTGPVAGLMTAMQSAPGVSMTALSLGDDGLVHATLASARAQDINTALLALQSEGFTITATSSADPGGRVLAEITVKP